MLDSSTVPLISLKGIKRIFDLGGNAVEILKGIDLEIYAGEFVAIVGASGSGKSTLMNILGCLDRASAGEYLFRGSRISELENDSLAELRREEFGFIFQGYHLIHALNARENVEVPAIYAGADSTERAERAENLLSALGLGERLSHRPNQLSGGQQQRVSIARALMNGGRVILADEPTGALDSKSGEEVMGLLMQLSKEGHTIILITHDSHVASHADRIIEMKDGLIINKQEAKIKKLPTVRSPFARSHPSLWLELTEAMKMAFRSLRTNLFRTALTLLGIVIGVTSVIVMLAIGDGAKNAVLDRIGGMGTNILVVRPGMPNSRGFSGIATLVPGDMDAIMEVDNVIAAMPENRKSVTTRYGSSDQSTSLIATSTNFTIVRNWLLDKGVFFTEEDERNYAKVVVLGKTVEKALFGDEDSLGKFILVDNIMFEVIGVMASRGASSGGDDQDDVILIPYTTGSLQLIGYKYLRNITVAMDDLKRIDETEQAIRATVLQRHGGVEDFRIHNMASLIEDATQTQNTLTILLGSVAAISLLVGGIGVMNIMLVSVTERTKEIGIRMATGARMRNILQQFLIESVVVSALGGFIGVILGVGISAIVASFGTAVHYSFMPIIWAFGCSFVTGLLFGYLPAKKAARLDPVVALASE